MNFTNKCQQWKTTHVYFWLLRWKCAYWMILWCLAGNWSCHGQDRLISGQGDLQVRNVGDRNCRSGMGVQEYENSFELWHNNLMPGAFPCGQTENWQHTRYKGFVVLEADHEIFIQVVMSARREIACHVTSHLDTSCFVMSRLVTSHFVTSRLVFSCFVTTRLVSSCIISSRLVTSHFSFRLVSLRRS